MHVKLDTIALTAKYTLGETMAKCLSPKVQYPTTLLIGWI